MAIWKVENQIVKTFDFQPLQKTMLKELDITLKRPFQGYNIYILLNFDSFGDIMNFWTFGIHNLEKKSKVPF
jgi:hypothetical protein